MRNLLIAFTGFLVGTSLVVGLVGRVAANDKCHREAGAAQTVAMPQMNGGISAMSSGTTASASLATQKLTIQHVQKGCHVWSEGRTTGTRLHLKPGQKLSILDQDVDAHQILQFACPMHLRTGGPIMTNCGTTLAFTRRASTGSAPRRSRCPGSKSTSRHSAPTTRVLVTVA